MADPQRARELAEKLERSSELWRSDRDELRAALLALADEVERLRGVEAENRILRGAVQMNPDWKCPHGYAVDNIGKCPLGFPGCACADDRIAVLCDDEERIVSRLRATQLPAELREEARRLLTWIENGNDWVTPAKAFIFNIAAIGEEK